MTRVQSNELDSMVIAIEPLYIALYFYMGTRAIPFREPPKPETCSQG